MISERIKQNAYHNTFAKVYFWRTKQQQEVDFVEEKNGQITGYEFKWNARNSKLPETFTSNYQAKSVLVERSNFRDFVHLRV